jgi:hypothetical protein
MWMGFRLVALLLLAGAALAAEALEIGRAAFGDWRSDAPGVRRVITPADLPSPFATLSAANPSGSAARAAGQSPRSRVIRAAPSGDILVAETGAGRLRHADVMTDETGP